MQRGPNDILRFHLHPDDVWVPICTQTIFRVSACMQGGPKGSAMSSSQQTGQWRGPAASVGPCCWTGKSTSTQLPMAAAPLPLSPASQWRAAGSASATLLQTQTSLSASVRPVALYSRHFISDFRHLSLAVGQTCCLVWQTLDTTADTDLVVSIGKTCCLVQQALHIRLQALVIGGWTDLLPCMADFRHDCRHRFCGQHW